MARKDGIPEVQHYVPRMLLENFAFQGKGKRMQIHVFDKHTERKFVVGTNKIVAEKQFNECEIEGELYSLEHPLSVVEQKAAEAFAKVFRERNLSVWSKEDRQWVSSFVATQLLRTKTRREDVAHMDRMICQWISDSGGDPNQVEGFKPLQNDEQIKAFSLTFLAENAADFALLLEAKDWMLLEAPSKMPFWIGDNPVALKNDNDLSPRGNLGLAVTGIQIFLPISKTLTLAMLCPSIRNDLRQSLSRIDRAIATLRMGRIIGARPNFEAIDSRLAEVEAGRRPAIELLSAIETGSPTICNADNVTFHNSLQVGYADQFVMASHSDFSLVEEMLRDTPDRKRGPRGEVVGRAAATR